MHSQANRHVHAYVCTYPRRYSLTRIISQKLHDQIDAVGTRVGYQLGYPYPLKYRIIYYVSNENELVGHY